MSIQVFQYISFCRIFAKIKPDIATYYDIISHIIHVKIRILCTIKGDTT